MKAVILDKALFRLFKWRLEMLEIFARFQMVKNHQPQASCTTFSIDVVVV